MFLFCLFDGLLMVFVRYYLTLIDVIVWYLSTSLVFGGTIRFVLMSVLLLLCISWG